MTAPTFFTVVADYKSVVVDLASDVDADPQLGPITAKVTFTPVLAKGDVILATNASPRPTGYLAAPIVARIDADGRLKLRVEPDGDRDDFATTAAFPATGTTAKVYYAINTQTFYRWTGSAYAVTYPYAAVRLLADTPLLELDGDLYYRVSFSEVVFNGQSGYISPFVFQAPTTDVELNLIEVTPVPGELASGQTKIAPGAVRLDDGDIVFSFAGVDIPNAIPFEPTFDVSEITDSGVIGRDLVQAETAASARATIESFELTANSTQLRTYEIDTTPLTASDVGAYTREEVDEAIDAAKDRTELITPRINSIYDVNGKEILRLGPQANAVNFVQITNGTSGNGPSFDAVGTATNLSLTFSPKGSGGINYYLGSGQTSIRLFVAGTAPNIDLNLQTQGTGTVQANSVPVVTTTGSQTLTNKSLTSPAITTPTGIVKADVGLGNVDNTSNATERAATATLANKTLTTPRIESALTDINGRAILYMDPKTTAVNYLVIKNGAAGQTPGFQVLGTDTNVSLNLQSQGTGTVQANSVPVVTTTGSQTLTNKSLTAPTLSTATPASATATGTTGTIVWDADYIYICTATNTWKRAAITTW
jgi:hypothetical protein